MLSTQCVGNKGGCAFAGWLSSVSFSLKHPQQTPTVKHSPWAPPFSLVHWVLCITVSFMYYTTWFARADVVQPLGHLGCPFTFDSDVNIKYTMNYKFLSSISFQNTQHIFQHSPGKTRLLLKLGVSHGSSTVLCIFSMCVSQGPLLVYKKGCFYVLL